MIRYSLVCEYEHEFESWFDSSDAYDRLKGKGLIECPHCGSLNVRKAIMTPQINTSRAVETQEATAVMTAPDERLEQLQTEAVNIARQIRDHIKENADYVGDRFASEARKIHDEEKPARGIYGEASADEVRELKEDGIDVLPVPELPEDKN